ncbi:hypothetical protein GDO81_001438 [Engystomops pustulosus]|uniref:Hemogen n=2 Tax=Engystomops pustulosus TaxID=76066 RepID=A0AAV7DD51_ENGPU|nr:hypothetical protein GDO81_001438 [Engystomops pustulosus]
MGDAEKDHHYSEPSGPPPPAIVHHEEKQESPVPIRRRLRDREMLKRKKEEAQEKDTYQEKTSTKRQRKTKGSGRGRRKQVKEPELEPQPEPEQEPVHEVQQDQMPEEEHLETEAENKFELLSDVPQVHVEHEQEQKPLVHQEDSVATGTKEEPAEVTLLIHEEADGHLPQETSSLLKDKEEAAESHPVPDTEVTGLPDVFAFPLDQEQVEHQYYTPLL